MERDSVRFSESRVKSDNSAGKISVSRDFG
jgi:hypothetical protein